MILYFKCLNKLCGHQWAGSNSGSACPVCGHSGIGANTTKPADFPAQAGKEAS